MRGMKYHGGVVLRKANGRPSNAVVTKIKWMKSIRALMASAILGVFVISLSLIRLIPQNVPVPKLFSFTSTFMVLMKKSFQFGCQWREIGAME